MNDDPAGRRQRAAIERHTPAPKAPINGLARRQRNRRAIYVLGSDGLRTRFTAVPQAALNPRRSERERQPVWIARSRRYRRSRSHTITSRTIFPKETGLWMYSKAPWLKASTTAGSLRS